MSWFNEDWDTNDIEMTRRTVVRRDIDMKWFTEQYNNKTPLLSRYSETTRDYYRLHSRLTANSPFSEETEGGEFVMIQNKDNTMKLDKGNSPQCAQTCYYRDARQQGGTTHLWVKRDTYQTKQDTYQTKQSASCTKGNETLAGSFFEWTHTPNAINCDMSFRSISFSHCFCF